jgi:hypothetical protein
MTTDATTVDDWRSAWPDALAFVAGLAMAWRWGWTTTDLVWSLWLASLVVGYATIVWTILWPGILIVRGGLQDGVTIRTSGTTSIGSGVAGLAVLALIGLFLLAFFTVHFGGFHYVHSQFLGGFFPIDTGTGAPRFGVDMATYREVARRYWWFLPSAFLAERAAFLRIPAAAARQRDRPVDPIEKSDRLERLERAMGDPKKKNSGGMMVAPYRNVIRMHLLIFFFGFAHAIRLESFAVYAVVYAVYFFPWRLVRRAEAATPTLVLPGS